MNYQTKILRSLGVIIIALLVAVTTYAQPKVDMKFNTNLYEKEWKEIDELKAKQRPKSMQEKVETLYQRAKADNNPAQVVKTLIYWLDCVAQLDEQTALSIYAKLKKETEDADFPVRSIAHSIMGEFLASYAANNAYQIGGRTAKDGYESQPLDTWTLGQLIEQSNRHYLASVRNKDLAKVDIEMLAAITTEAKGVKGLRPDLYSFLANRALMHFGNTFHFINEPINAFVFDDAAAFGDIEAFVNAKFTSEDEGSSVFQALKLHQSLLKEVRDSGNEDALVVANLARLKFVYSNSVHAEKETLYIQALEAAAERYKGNNYTGEVKYAIATYYNHLGETYYAGGDDTHQFARQKAAEIAQDVIRDYPNTYGSQQCLTLLRTIEEGSLAVQIESVVPSQMPMLYRLDYRNTKEVYIKVVRLDEEEFLRQEWYEKTFFNAVIKKSAVWKKTETLPDQKDYQIHGVEGAIDKLDYGQYAVFMSDNQSFSRSKGKVSVAVFTVSDLAYVARSGSGDFDMLAVDRMTGSPLQGVQVDFYKQEYKRAKRRSVRVKMATVSSDLRGKVACPLEREHYGVSFTMQRGKDILYSERDYSLYKRNDNRREISTTHFFLDRAIYRPGQKLYFKALAITKNIEGEPSINKNTPIEITLLDANYQEISKQKMTTNEYGTVSGEFILPASGRRGQMQIKSSIGGNSQFFRVEEYKRPQFEVVTSPLEGEYQLNEEITVEGMAKAFAGNSVSGAQVKYRVTREVRYPWWPWWRGYRPSYNSGSKEIAQGTTMTDDEGKFEVKFVALPDASVNDRHTPSFYYTIHAEVVDITGETHSKTTSVQVSSRSLLVSLSGNDIADSQEGQYKLALSTTNLNGKSVGVKGNLVISKLVSPTQQYVKRYWERPDLELLRKRAFTQKFPNYAYRNEDKKENWAIEKEQVSRTFDTQKVSELEFDISKWEVGTYVIEMTTKDKNGNEIQQKHYVEIQNQATQSYPFFTDLSVKAGEQVYEVGQTANIQMVNTSAKPTFVFFEEIHGKNAQGEWLTIQDAQTKGLLVGADDKGGFNWQLVYVKNNRMTFEQGIIAVPWRKDLDISLATYRDKLEPGSEEEWKILVKGEDGDGLVAELVAGMYDASLDQFVQHNWRQRNYWPHKARYVNAWQSGTFMSRGSYLLGDYRPLPNIQERYYRQLNYFGTYWLAGRTYTREAVFQSLATDAAVPKSSPRKMKRKAESAEVAGFMQVEADIAPVADEMVLEETEEGSNSEAAGTGEIVIRKNLNETVFFQPHLYTDEGGNVVLKFKMNEALTRWKLMLFGHTKDLKTATLTQEVVTQKELMVQPNAPRFVREGDRITLTAKVSNLTDEQQTGEATLKLFDAMTMRPVDKTLGNRTATTKFEVDAQGTALVAWDIFIPPSRVSALKYQVVATTANFSDGEENAVPVVTNRMLVTETMPMTVKAGETEKFFFEELANRKSTSLEHHKVSLEFTSNPVWYAVKALPYMMEYPYNCSEQIFTRYYANTLAASVANSHPNIQRVLDSWKDTDALDSELTKNKELKTALLKETPWVLDATDETEQRHNIALLFDLNRMAKEQAQALGQLRERQSNSGGFAWFPGGRESRYITQYLVEGMGRLQHLGAVESYSPKNSQMLDRAIQFIDEELIYEYKEMKRQKDKDHLSNTAIHYLYVRSFFDNEMSRELQKIVNYYRKQSAQKWNEQNLYSQALIALALHRAGGYETTVDELLTSFRERAIQHKEKGMYWKYTSGYFWHQMPIETHSTMIEVFSEVAKDTKAVDQLRTWLLMNKETTNWKTTKATANAVYALLVEGSDWLADTKTVNITLPKAKKQMAVLTEAMNTQEAGSGYFKASWESDEIAPDMATVKVHNPNKVVSWGSVYWQYFEDLDKIKSFEKTPLQLKKQLYKVTLDQSGEKLVRIYPKDEIAPGTKIKVRIELRVDRAMEYVHMKDMRASGFEPINVLSQYKWQDGLGYYESTGDVATDFFFDRLEQGTYVFEYPVRAVHKGDFSNGVTTIQCMYAPKYTSHSEGIRVKVD